jgi:hypothetical protein
MKGIILSALLLAACAQTEKQAPLGVTDQNISQMTSLTWCEDTVQPDGFVDSYRFYSDGRVSFAKWNQSKNEFGSFSPMTWSLSGKILTLSAQDQVPKDRLFSFEFVNVRQKLAINLVEQQKAKHILLEQCKLPRDPR